MFAASQVTDFKIPFKFVPPGASRVSTNNVGGSDPDRRATLGRSQPWLAAALDEIDYGMLVLTEETHSIQVNHAARVELDATHPLQLLGGELRARRAKDAPPLAEALRAAARRGLRKLLTLGEGAQQVSISVVPLVSADDGRGPVTLVMLGKRQVCCALSVQGFARSQGLSAAEGRVLAALCNGLPPNEIAAQLFVAISTVRSHIRSMRQKTGAQNIRGLVQKVAVLPPLMGVLRGVTNGDGVVCSDIGLMAA